MEEERKEEQAPEEEIKDLEVQDEQADEVTGGAKRFHRPDGEA